MVTKETYNKMPAPEDFSRLIDGKQVALFLIGNDKLTVALTNYGARVVSIIVPDKNGNLTDVVAGPGTAVCEKTSAAI